MGALRALQAVSQKSSILFILAKLNYYSYFTVPIWSRDCEIPEHRVFDVDYQLVKNCDFCTIYREKMPIQVVKALLHELWMGLE